MVDLNFLVKIDPGFFERTDATDRLCQWCFLQPACHDHHKEFKKMGGSGRKAKAYIERKENHMDACLVCHEAFHGIRVIMATGFCCDICPRLAKCRYGCKTLKLPYEHLPEYSLE